jgi:hypothetical protein
MTPELKAAAERLRQVRSPTIAAIGDVGIVANAWLADNLPDDDELITGEWLRSLGLPAFKHCGEYREHETTLMILEKESAFHDDRFWVCNFGKDKGDEWRVSLDVQDGNRHAGTLYLASVKTHSDVRRLASALGLTLEPKE